MRNIVNLSMIKRKHSGQDISIFSEMSALAAKHRAVNLSQGFPDYETDPRLRKLLGEASDLHYNQYPPMSGLPVLRENLLTFNRQREIPLQLELENIMITPGASYAIFMALATVLEPGDEVIVLEPSYDSYVPSIETNGGVPVYVSLKDDFSVDFEALKNAVNAKTKAIMVNSPHNPSGYVWTQSDWNQLAEITTGTGTFVISDEVYDILTYDGNPFYSAFHHPDLRERCFSIFSFGKMFHVTGWKVGYVFASAELLAAFGRVHQYAAFCVNAPAQYALAKYLEIFDVKENRRVMQYKRDFFTESFAGLPFSFEQKAGAGYFQLLKLEDIDLNDRELAFWLTEKAGVAAVPLSAFYKDRQKTGLLRFCFAKKEETIERAALNLKKFFGS